MTDEPGASGPTGETDLDAMLDGLTVNRRPGTFVFAHLEVPVALGDGVEALVAEDEATTVVATRDRADSEGWSYSFEAAWLTLEVHSAPEAVGLTAAFSAELTKHQISCNVIAGFFHDHLLVPTDRAEEAITALEGLRQRR